MGLWSFSMRGGGKSLCIWLGRLSVGGLCCRSELDLATVIFVTSLYPFIWEVELPRTIVCKESEESHVTNEMNTQMNEIKGLLKIPKFNFV